MVQAFPPNRTDDPFDVSALPRRPRSAENFFDIHDRDLIAELLAIDSISISHQISRRRIEGKGFKHLLRCPFGCRVSRNVEVNNASSIMCENDKDKQHFKPNGVDSKEVDGRELRNVIIEERRHVCKGGFGLRTMYLATEASETLMPNFINSL